MQHIATMCNSCNRQCRQPTCKAYNTNAYNGTVNVVPTIHTKHAIHCTKTTLYGTHEASVTAHVWRYVHVQVWCLAKGHPSHNMQLKRWVARGRVVGSKSRKPRSVEVRQGVVLRTVNLTAFSYPPPQPFLYHHTTIISYRPSLTGKRRQQTLTAILLDIWRAKIKLTLYRERWSRSLNRSATPRTVAKDSSN